MQVYVYSALPPYCSYYAVRHGAHREPTSLRFRFRRWFSFTSQRLNSILSPSFRRPRSSTSLQLNPEEEPSSRLQFRDEQRCDIRVGRMLLDISPSRMATAPPVIL